MNQRIFKIISVFLILHCSLSAQVDTNTIILINGSFEGVPQCCSTPVGWVDCGWRNETPPDIQPQPFGQEPLFKVTKKAFDGQTYIGLVTRDNDSYERVAQKLTQPMRKGRCYSFSVYMCRSLEYLSASNTDIKLLKPFTSPIVLRIYSGDAYCHQRELLAESKSVEDTSWKKYTFEFRPTTDCEYLELEAFYKTPVLKPYNGNILLDRASEIKRLACPNEKLIVQKDQKSKIIKLDSPKVDSKKVVVKENKILKALDKDKIKVGQTIKIEKLYFQSDSSNIDSTSYAVLEEVYVFLNSNPKIKIEIGGHTNSIPPHEYCDKLSSMRAQSVKQYILNKGINSDRISSRGYGKRSPVSTNDTKLGRALNQRVEIKIISLG